MSYLSQQSNIPQHIQKLIDDELEPHETLKWVSQPTRPWLMTIPSFGIWFFAIPWTAFSLFWMAGAAGFKVPNFDSGEDYFPLFGLPFLLIGLGMLSVPYWTFLDAKETYYVITSERAIILKGKKRVDISSYYADDMRNITKRVAPDGSGKVVFHKRFWRDSDGDRHSKQIGFFGIDNVNEIEDMLQEIVDDADAKQQ